MAVTGNVVRRSIGGAMMGLAVFGLAACGGSRASEADIKDKLVELFEAEGTLKDQAEPLADCMAPKVSEQLSDDGVETIMDADPEDVISGDVGDMSSDDTSKFQDIATECATEIYDTTGGGSAPTS